MAYEAAMSAQNALPDNTKPVSSLWESTRPPTKIAPGDELARGARPYIPYRASIDHYSGRELGELVAWIKSDGRLRDDDELFEAVFAELPFRVRGKKIVARLRQAINR